VRCAGGPEVAPREGIVKATELDFGQFSLLGNGRFAGISDAGGNFRTVPGASGTHKKFGVPLYSGAFRASAASKIGQSQAEYRPFSASNPAERIDDSRAKTVKLQPDAGRQQAV
jgi:hypothetical protein